MDPSHVFYACFTIFVLILQGIDSKNDCNYCLWERCIPSIQGINDDQFNALTDVKNLRGGIGYVLVDKNRLIDILTERRESQRNAIVTKYASLYPGRTLREDIQVLMHGEGKTILTALVTPLPMFYTHQLQRAIKIRNTVRIVEILTILPPCAVKDIRTLYVKLYKVNLDDAFKSAFRLRFSDKDFIEVLNLLASGERKEYPIGKQRNDQIDKDAKALKSAIGRDAWMEIHAILREVFLQRTLPQIKVTVAKYEAMKKGSTLESDIEKAGLESVHGVYTTILQLATDQPTYFADKLLKMLQKRHLATIDRQELIYFIRGRCDIDLGNIKNAFYKKNNIHLYDSLVKKIKRKGSYYNAILNIIKH